MEKKVRVLHIVTHMNSGGLENMIMNNYRILDKNRFQFDFLECRLGKHDFTDEIQKLGGRIFQVMRIDILTVLGFRNQFYDFFREHPEYDVIHVHLDSFSKYALQGAKKAGVKTRIVHSHSSGSENLFKKVVRSITMRNIEKYSTDQVACSTKAGDWLFKNSNYRILKNTIDAQKYRYSCEKETLAKKDLGIGDELVIGHIGRFSEVKNHDFIIQIFYEIYKKQPNSKLILVGDGELRKVIEERVFELGLESNVIFLGKRKDIYHVIHSFDVFVFPSKYEGAPVALIEAQAAGLKCFVSDAISRESVLLDNVEMLSIYEPPAIWANKILESSVGKNKSDQYLKIVESGYDTIGNIHELLELYERDFNNA